MTTINHQQIGGLTIAGYQDGQTWKNFRIQTDNYRLSVLRMMIGSVTITHSIERKSVRQKTDYTVLPYDDDATRSTKDRLNAFLTAHASSETALTLGKYLVDSKISNLAFYKRLATELGYAFLFKENNPIASFVHAYRVMETIAYALPTAVLLHRNNDYMGSYSALKQLFTGDKVVELGFFKKFIESSPAVLRDYVFDIRVQSVDEPCKIAIHRKLLDFCKKHKAIESEVSAGSITIIGVKTLQFFNVISEIRNRYFHYQIGDRTNNFSFTDSITNPEDIFRSINDTMLNWICIIICDLMEEEIAYKK